MKITKTDIFFVLIIVAHLIGQLVLLGDFSVDDLAFATLLEPTKDCPAHQTHIQVIENIINEGDGNFFVNIVDLPRIYPPLFHYLAAVLASFSSDGEYYVIRCGVLLFSVLIFFLIYSYFRRKNDPLTGIWAVLLTACCPFFLLYSTGTTPHMLMVLFIVYIFMLAERTDGFRNRGWAVFLGFMSGLSLFVKQEALIYCFAIYLISVIPVIVKPTGRQIGNLALSLCLFLNFLIYFVDLYILYLDDFFYYLTLDHNDYIANAGLFSFPSFSFYGKTIFDYLAGPYVAVLACVAVIFHFIEPRLARERTLIFFCVIVLLIFTCILTKWEEYVCALIPFIAIICARAIGMIRARFVQSIIVITVCFLTLNAYALPLYFNRLSTIDTNQYEVGKVWDMIVKHIPENTTNMVDVHMYGDCGFDFMQYIFVRSAHEGYKVLSATRLSIQDYPLEGINNIADATIIGYVSDSEDKSWPTKEELWDEFKRSSSRDKNITPSDWQKVVDCKDSFVEVARDKVIIANEPKYVFIYRNRALIEEKKM